MKPWLIGILSFVLKEIHEVRRQPSLLVSLIGGPFLVLALFGVAFRSPNPVLRTVLVWPQGDIPGVERKVVEDVIKLNFDLVEVVTDEDEAMQMLASGRVEVVQIIPANLAQARNDEDQPKLQIYSYTWRFP